MLSTLLAPAAVARWCFVLSAGSVLVFTSCDRQPPTAPPAPDQAQLDKAPKTNALSFSALDAGSIHTCAFTAAGEGYCWGRNVSGQLGNGTSTDSNRPVPVGGGLTLSVISAGASSTHTCSIADGTFTPLVASNAYCWGSNDRGQLGNGTTVSSNQPVSVFGGRMFSVISAGWWHTCGIEDNQAYCWGNNGSGQLGNGSKMNSTVPVAVVGGHKFSGISAGAVYNCGIAAGVEAGKAYCWGNNEWGQLGNGTNILGSTVGSTQPAAVAGGLTFSAISAGYTHTCALELNTYQAYCWGDNGSGQLGIGTPDRWQHIKPTPVAVVGGLTFSAISVGAKHTCALTSSNGKAYCWGSNDWGQLGDGTTTDSTEPVAVVGGRKFTAISAGGSYISGDGSYTCALESRTGRAYCWGANDYGQLGTGNNTHSTEPVAVVAP